MKKLLCILISAIMVTSVFTALPINAFAATKKVFLKKTSATLKISKKNGKTVCGTTDIKVNAAKGVTLKKITYKSSNTKIAKVTTKGKVTAKKQGSAKITVTVKYKARKSTYTKKLYFKVTVKDVRPKPTAPTKATEPSSSESPTEPSSQSDTSEPSESTEPASSETPSFSESEPTQPSEPSSETEPTSTAHTTGTHTVVLDASGVDTGSVEWRAWTWADDQDGYWIFAQGNTFNNIEDNVLFACFTAGSPVDNHWTGKIAQSVDMKVDGDKFTVTSVSDGTVTGKWNSYIEPTSPSEPSSTDPNAQAKALNSVSQPTNYSYSFEDTAFLKKLSKFSNKLYTLSAEDKSDNYAMSPVSVYMALSMLYAIGDDNVKSDIEALTEMNSSDIAQTGKLFKYLSREYTYYDKTISSLNLTNSIWLNNGTEADTDTLKMLADDFFCSAFEAPFSANNQAANKAIRDFIKQNTKGLIDQDFGLSENTLFALINTLYFKDVWSTQIEQLSSAKKTFNAPDGNVTADFLYGFYTDGQVQETDCCYYFYTETSCGYKAKFILPKEGCTLKQAMSAENLNKINQDKEFDAIDGKYKHLTRCIFPSFKIESDTALKTILEKNNYLTNAFREYFSPLVNNGLCVSDIKHKTVIDVTKEGIEGAAVTIIANEATCAPEEYEPVYHDFTLNSSFGFIITDRTDVVLFEGQVTNPTK